MIEKCWNLYKVTRGIAVEGQLGENNEVSAALFGAVGNVDDKGTIAFEIADGRIDLSERDPHGMAV